MPVSYYNQLKAQLDADALAKKTAIDSRLAAYTQAMFDASGNVSYKEPGKLGTRDVKYDTDTRNIKASGESSGMLRSGQQARNLATNLASYKADVIGASGQATADKTAIDTASATELAKYQATYGTGSSTDSAAPSGSSKPKEVVPENKAITPPPTLNTPIPSQSTVGLSPSRVASEYKTPATTPKAPATPKTPKAPVTPKKALPPKRIGGY